MFTNTVRCQKYVITREIGLYFICQGSCVCEKTDNPGNSTNSNELEVSIPHSTNSSLSLHMLKTMTI